jgi:hypothetical protein
MDKTSTRQRLVAANNERRYFECGGESKFSNLEDADTEILCLHRQLEAEERAERVGRREELRGLLVEADVAQAAADLAAREARKRYQTLREEAAHLEYVLSREPVWSAEAVV